MPGREKPKDDMIVPSKETHAERAFISLRPLLIEIDKAAEKENEGKGDREELTW
jgi:hypothetical protein